MDNKEKKFKGIRIGVRIIVTTLVEIFVGAATKSVLHDVDGGKAAKLGAKAGGFLVGMYVSDKVSDYICDGIDETIADIEEIEAGIDNEDEEE